MNADLNSEQIILNKVHEGLDQSFSLNVGKVSVEPAGDSLSRQTGHKTGRYTVNLKKKQISCIFLKPFNDKRK